MVAVLLVELRDRVARRFLAQSRLDVAQALRGVEDVAGRELRGDLVLDRSAYEPIAHDPAAFDGEALRPYNAGPDAQRKSVPESLDWLSISLPHLTIMTAAGADLDSQQNTQHIGPALAVQ